MKELLEKSKSIAVIGYSDNHSRASHDIAKYLLDKDYKIYGVNPRLACKEVNGINCYESISSIPDEVDLFNIFRNSIYLKETVEEILQLQYKPRGIWTQIGVVDEDAKSLVVEAGLDYIENECIFVEHRRLFS